MSILAWTASTVDEVKERARTWLLSAALAHLVAELDGPAPSLDHLTNLRRWSANTLDSRKGAERRDAVLVTHTPAVLDALKQSAEPLGLVTTPPPTRQRYDLVIILAGASTGNRLRTLLARSILGDVDAGALVALASARALSPSEIADDPDSADDGCEWRNLLRYVADAFGPLAPGARDAGDIADQKLVTRDDSPVRVLVAPEHDGRRPTTPMQLQFLRERIAKDARQTALLITSSIYVPYQFFSGIPEVLADGAQHAELIGTDTSTTGDPVLLGQRLAQEIHAGIDAATKLVRPQDHPSPR